MNKVALLAFAVACTALAFAGCGEGSVKGSSAIGGLPTSLPSSNASLLLPPAGSIYLGVFVNPSQQPSPPVSLLSDFEQTVGRRMALSTHYYGFYDSFPGYYEQNDEANGRIPIDSWDCQPSNAAVASGKDDAAIVARAQAIKAFGYPIFLRYMWEMNLASSPTFRAICYDPATDLPNGQFSPQNFIAAWDHIRAIFAQQGVTNVVWVWNPSGASDPLAYYPGNNETDWIGFDRYDVGNLTMDATYTQAYIWLNSVNHGGVSKPIMIGETGASTAEQPQFFSSAAQTLQGDFPNVKAFVYFDSANPNYADTYNWGIETSAGLTAITAMANDPYFSAMQP
jgi:hypothetical protein